MTSSLLGILANATLVSSGAIALTLVLRKPLRGLLGPGLAYFLWLLVPTSLLVLLLPAPVHPLHAVLSMPLSVPHSMSPRSASRIAVAWVSLSSGPEWGLWLLSTWGVGAVAFCSMLVYQQRRFVTGLGALVRQEDGVLRAGTPGRGPAVSGVLRPKIIVPSDFDSRYTPQEQELILAHERMHVRRGDLVVNALCALARCIFWLNPLVHVAAGAIRLDQELACDAAVMRKHPRSAKPYANAMLTTQLTGDALPLGCYWISSHPLKERIMLLKQPPARGVRRVLGQTLLGLCVGLVGYGSWAAQSDAGLSMAASRMTYADSGLRIFSDSVQASEHGVRYTGNVIVEVPATQEKPEVAVDAQTAQGSAGGMHLEGNVSFRVVSRDPFNIHSDSLWVRTSDRLSASSAPRGRAQVFDGNVRIDVAGHVLTTDHMSLRNGKLHMDEVEMHTESLVTRSVSR